jgi:achilleol B synthase
MWRLRIGEGSGPWLRSANNFIGRQVWEFDPDAGSQDELAEIERLRKEFTENRFQKRVSQDLLLRMQVITSITEFEIYVFSMIPGQTDTLCSYDNDRQHWK